MGKSKYKASYAAEMLAYFSSYSEKGVPQFSKFARKIGVTLRTLENWRDSKKKFAEAYGECEAIQREMLVDCGLEGRYNSRVTIFMLEQKNRDAGEQTIPRFEDL